MSRGRWFFSAASFLLMGSDILRKTLQVNCSCRHTCQTSAAPHSRQLLQEDLRLLQVSSVKALGEPVIDFGEQLAGRVPLALALPQATQAHDGSQLQGFRLLAASHVEGLMKAGFRLRYRVCRPRQQQLSLQPIQLSLVK